MVYLVLPLMMRLGWVHVANFSILLVVLVVRGFVVMLLFMMNRTLINDALVLDVPWLFIYHMARFLVGLVMCNIVSLFTDKMSRFFMHNLMWHLVDNMLRLLVHNIAGLFINFVPWLQSVDIIASWLHMMSNNFTWVKVYRLLDETRLVMLCPNVERSDDAATDRMMFNVVMVSMDLNPVI